MGNTVLNRFVEKVMRINAGYAGMGGASAAIIGASSTNDEVIHHLRKNTIAFASECSKPATDQKHLKQLAGQLQGSFFSLKLVNAISEERFNELSSELDALIC